MKLSDQMLVMMTETQRLLERVRSDELDHELSEERRERILLRAQALQNDLTRFLGHLKASARPFQTPRSGQVLSIRSRLP